MTLSIFYIILIFGEWWRQPKDYTLHKVTKGWGYTKRLQWIARGPTGQFGSTLAYTDEKLREATYTAAVCKFRGGEIFIVLDLVPSVAQFSSASYYFLCFPAATYVHLDTWWDPYCIVEVVWFISECGTAQLSLSLFFLFSCATADIVIDVDGLNNILPLWSSST